MRSIGIGKVFGMIHLQASRLLSIAIRLLCIVAAVEISLLTAFAYLAGPLSWVSIMVAVILLLISGPPVYFILLRELTAQVGHWEENLLKEQRFSLAIFNAANTLVVVLDRGGKFVRVNQAFEGVSGYLSCELENVLYRGILAFPEEACRMHTVMDDVSTGRAAASLELHLTTMTGDRRLIDWSYTVMKNDDGSTDYIIGVGTDITERREAEERMKSIAGEWKATFNAMPDGVSVHSPQFGLLDANDSLCRMLGKSRDELIGKKCSELFHDKGHPMADCFLEKPNQLGQAFSVERYEPAMNTWVSFSAAPLFDDCGQVAHIVLVARDVTEYKLKEERIQRQLRQISALHDIDIAITASLDMRLTLDVLLDRVMSHLEVDAVGVSLLNEHSLTFQYVAGRGFRRTGIASASLWMGEGIMGAAAWERRVICVPDLMENDHDFVRTSQISEEEFVTYHAVPLVTKGRVMGVLDVFHRTPFTPDKEWMDFLKTLATQAAIAIENASLLDDLRGLNTELRQAYDTTLEGWSRAMDLRDKETEGHTRRVTEMTVQLGRELGISEAELVNVRRGALLHDIGKMGIPDYILLKRESLTYEEWCIMRQHPIFAYELLSPIPYLRSAIDIPYCHHEMWDGNGYPRGLQGEQIPLGARLFAVVDVWDALRSNRPYRPAWPEEKVREHLRSLSGTHFEPRMVDTFLGMS